MTKSEIESLWTYFIWYGKGRDISKTALKVEMKMPA